MKFTPMIAAAALAIMSTTAFAGPGDKDMPKSRAEMITHLKEKVAKLEKMSDADWEKERAEKHEKWGGHKMGEHKGMHDKKVEDKAATTPAEEKK